MKQRLVSALPPSTTQGCLCFTCCSLANPLTRLEKLKKKTKENLTSPDSLAARGGHGHSSGQGDKSKSLLENVGAAELKVKRQFHSFLPLLLTALTMDLMPGAAAAIL